MDESMILWVALWINLVPIFTHAMYTGHLWRDREQGIINERNRVEAERKNTESLRFR